MHEMMWVYVGVVATSVAAAGNMCGLPPVCPEGRCDGLSRMDVVIPTYHVDLCRVEIQIRSIEIFNVCKVVGDIHIVWADSQPVPKAPKNTIIHVLPVFGWKGQQIAKLEAYRFVKTEWYLVLDSKNVFVAPITPSGLCAFAKSSQSLTDYRGWGQAAADVLGIDGARGRIPRSITPHLMHRRRVEVLLQVLGSRGGIFQALEYGATEFMLYEIYGLFAEDGAFEPWRVAGTIKDLMPVDVPYSSITAWASTATDARAALEFEVRMKAMVSDIERGANATALILGWHHSANQGRFRDLFRRVYQNAGLILDDAQLRHFHRCFNATCRCLAS